MATMKIVEYARVQEGVARASGPVADISSLLGVQTVTFTTTTQSAALNSATRIVMVQVDADAYIDFGSNPTATTDDIPLMADQPHYFGVGAGGAGSKFAAVAV